MSHAACFKGFWRNDVMTAILNVWRFIRNPTPSIDAYLLQERICNDGRTEPSAFFGSGRAPHQEQQQEGKKLQKNKARWVAIWDQVPDPWDQVPDPKIRQLTGARSIKMSRHACRSTISTIFRRYLLDPSPPRLSRASDPSALHRPSSPPKKWIDATAWTLIYPERSTDCCWILRQPTALCTWPFPFSSGNTVLVHSREMRI